jgi:hypothetical protein
MKEFGAYYQVYKNPYATYKCLESFRKLYPSNTIVLASDNGYDYNKMAKHFNCIYIHYDENLWLIYEDTEDIKKGSNGRQLEWINKLLHRLSNGFKMIKEDYFIWLEDDVSVNNIINDELNCDINGYNPNAYWNSMLIKLNQVYSNIKIDNRYTWSGGGGSIFNKNNILKYMQNTDIINDIGNNWYTYDLTSNIVCDFLLSLITHLNDGTVGPLNNHYDCYYLETRIDIQHQYKVYYNIEMPIELKYLLN